MKGWLLHPEHKLNQLRYRSREPLRVAQQRDLRFQISIRLCSATCASNLLTRRLQSARSLANSRIYIGSA